MPHRLVPLAQPWDDQITIGASGHEPREETGEAPGELPKGRTGARCLAISASRGMPTAGCTGKCCRKALPVPAAI